MTVFNETAKTRISLAYDLFKREEFLERLFKFMKESEDLILARERMTQQSDALCNKIIEGAKTKPGPKAKDSELALT